MATTEELIMFLSSFFITNTLPQLLKGVWLTLQLASGSIIIAAALGPLVGIMLCARIRIPFVAPLLDGYVWCVRCLPFYTQLLMIYFVIPYVLGITLSPELAGIITLGLCSTGYVAEIVRGCINAIAVGQWEACHALGYSRYATFRRIILPQVVHNSLPALGGELIQVVHATSVIAAIGALELTKMGTNIIAREMNPLTIFPVIAVLYLIITSIIAVGVKKLEQRRNRYGSL
jgi:His/Glu/Gln/Arg/opine family amino acid ABC transporter permease subunit